MALKRGDKVRAISGNCNGIEGEVVGFYNHTMDALVRTEAGHEWIISPIHLQAVKKKK